ncbi:hypothetical protein ERO13_A02G049100v2 [Gossypium hirsutum]|nr:hypothetical protein ERO13_A02G049100v2 [Gossypium hirsutum]
MNPSMPAKIERKRPTFTPFRARFRPWRETFDDRPRCNSGALRRVEEATVRGVVAERRLKVRQHAWGLSGG